MTSRWFSIGILLILFAYFASGWKMGPQYADYSLYPKTPRHAINLSCNVLQPLTSSYNKLQKTDNGYQTNMHCNTLEWKIPKTYDHQKSALVFKFQTDHMDVTIGDMILPKIRKNTCIIYQYTLSPCIDLPTEDCSQIIWIATKVTAQPEILRISNLANRNFLAISTRTRCVWPADIKQFCLWNAANQIFSLKTAETAFMVSICIVSVISCSFLYCWITRRRQKIPGQIVDEKKANDSQKKTGNGSANIVHTDEAEKNSTIKKKSDNTSQSRKKKKPKKTLDELKEERMADALATIF